MAVSLDLTNPDMRPKSTLISGFAGMDDSKKPLVGLTRPQMAQALIEAGIAEKQARMRASQIWHWLYIRGVSDFSAMSNIGKELRSDLSRQFSIARPEIIEEQISNDGTRKCLMRFPPRGAGKPVDIETVYIPEEGRGTLCISSQVGCTLTCTFCHTGTQKLVRNLTSEEILAQLLVARDRLGEDSHVVALIGDAALTCGVTMEALNNAAKSTKRLVIVLNDNEWSIDRNVGAVADILSRLIVTRPYNNSQQGLKRFLSKTRLGTKVLDFGRSFKRHVKNWYTHSSSLFEQYGVRYVGPIDGHDLGALERYLNFCKDSTGPILLHVRTEKGRGLGAALKNPDAAPPRKMPSPEQILDHGLKTGPYGEGFNEYNSGEPVKRSPW